MAVLALWPVHILRIINCITDGQFAPVAWSELRGVVSTGRRWDVHVSWKIVSTVSCTKDEPVATEPCSRSPGMEDERHV